MKTIFISVLSFLIFSIHSLSQSITYADVDKADVAYMNFEILGKVADNYLIYKEAKGMHRICVYDYNMKLQQSIPITILPNRDKLLDISFFKSNGQFDLIYQYQDGDIVYLNLASIEANGHIVNQPVTLDTTRIAYKTKNKIYSLVNSADNSKLIAFKINKRDKNLFQFTTLLLSNDLQQITKNHFSLSMESNGNYLTGYSISNEGVFAFVKYRRESNGNISEATFIEKNPGSDDLNPFLLNLSDLYLDDIKVMADNASNRFLLTSFYSTQKRGNIDGLYVLGISNHSKTIDFEKTTLFTDDLKKRAKGSSNPKNAFDNFFINNIIVHNNGGFSIASEVLYSTNDWDRWGYWGSPYWSGLGWSAPGFWGGWGWGWNQWGGWWPYSYYSPYFYRSYWWSGWAGSAWGGNSSQRFNAGNIAIVSFDKEGNKQWDNVIVKSQSENNTDGSISYQVLPNKQNMRFIINNSNKISKLENITIANDGGVVLVGQNIQAKEKHLDFMPKYSKQTGAKEIVIPYFFKRNVSFAKIDF